MATEGSIITYICTKYCVDPPRYASKNVYVQQKRGRSAVCNQNLKNVYYRMGLIYMPYSDHKKINVRQNDERI